MKTKVFYVLTCCAVVLMTLSCSLLSAKNTNDELTKMEGKWTYTMQDPMGGGGSMKITCSIATTNGETKATFSSPMGDITSSALKLENGKYVGKMSFPEFEMTIAFSWKNDEVLLQELISDYGTMPPIEMTREI